MAEPSSNNDDETDFSKYAPRRLRDEPPLYPVKPPFVSSAPTVPLSSRAPQDRRTMSDTPGGPEPVPQPPLRLDETSTLIGRIAMVATFAAIFALVAVFAKPIWQGAQAMLDVVFPSSQSSKSNQLANGAAPDRTVVAPAKIATAGPELPAPQPPARAPATVPALTTGQASTNSPPPATMQPPANPPVQQQAALATDSPSQSAAPAQESKRVFARGITDNEIRFGISAPFSGAAKELGQNMKLGIEAAFAVANANGGVYGRKLRLIAADDGYEPKRTADTMKQLYEKDQVFGIVGNVGTPTATVALPYSLERKMLFFGAFTGAGLLRSDPPDRYVFNYRASYMEETDAVVQYLVKVKRLKTNQIAVFAQQDAYGDAGFAGVAKAVRALGGDDTAILRLNYQRNTVDVDAAVEDLKKHRIPIRAVIMVPAYRAAAKFIEKTRDLYPNMIYTSVSFVGSTALANELMLLGPRFANGVIVTQVVPAVDGHSSLVLDYKNALAKYFPGESPDYVSLEGYVAANVLIAALRRNGPDLDTEKLIATLENLRDLDLGLGTPVTFGRSEHQGVHKVWGSQLDANGHYQPLDLQ